MESTSNRRPLNPADGQRVITTETAPVVGGVLPSPYGAVSTAGPVVMGLDMVAGVAMVVMICGPLLCGVLRVG